MTDKSHHNDNIAAPQEIPLTQRALLCVSTGQPLQLVEDWPVVRPEDLKPGEALIKIAYSGVCEDDRHTSRGDWSPQAYPTKQLPVCQGHEAAGHIVAIGQHTGHTALQVGDAVGLSLVANTCHYCEHCRCGHEQHCARAKLRGATIDGTFQQYAVGYVHHLFPIPKNLSLENAAPLLCSGVSALHALKEIRGNPGDTVAVAGIGGLGHLAIQYALAMGYRVIAIDTGPAKKDLVESIEGEVYWVDYKEVKGVAKDVKLLTHGEGAHAALVCADKGAALAYDQALTYLRPRGTLVCLGMPVHGEIKLEIFPTIKLGLRVIGSFQGNRQDVFEALDLAARGQVKVSAKVETLPDIPRVFREMSRKRLVGSVVVDCQK